MASVIRCLHALVLFLAFILFNTSYSRMEVEREAVRESISASQIVNNNNGSTVGAVVGEKDTSNAERLEISREGAFGGREFSPEVPATEDKEVVDKEKRSLAFTLGDSIFEISSRLRIEGLYGVNLRFINDFNNAHDPQLDKIIYPGRHTLDSWFFYSYGRPSHGYDVIKFRCGIRNRGIWGNELSILPTANSTFKHVDAIIGDHFHVIPRHIFWARELWLEIVLNDLWGWKSPHRHTVTMGFFPFQLGRGISLGDAYDVDPDFIGFYATSAIDQFAPGFKFSGELISPDVLRYDFYVEIADNLSDSFTVVNQPVNAQRFGRRFDPARGFGVIDYLIAARLQWRPYNRERCRAYWEPYVLFVDDREQKIEYIADARGKFGITGLAGEFEWGDFEWGFDTAVNFGRQNVFGWDRNIIVEQNRSGFDVFAYDKVSETFTTRENTIEKRSALVTDQSKVIVDASKEGEQFNGKEIGTIGDTKLFNARDRYTNPYHNSVLGGMFVCDGGYTFRQSGVKILATAGFATGGDDPNKDLQSMGDSNFDTHFKGFFGFQELYSGQRVRSLFLLAGQGHIPRLLGVPAVDVVNRFPTIIGRFSNIILTGVSAEFKPVYNSVVWNIKPNILAFWAYHPSRVFTAEPVREDNSTIQRSRIDFVADKFLGTEYNVLIEADLLKDLRLFASAALFVPGSFYDDLKGTPLSRDERAFLDSLATPNIGAPALRVATLGNDPAYFINVGLEYKF